MNICMLTSYFFPTIGGVEAHIYNVSKSLIQMGHNVVIFHTVIGASPDGQEFICENVDGINVYRLYLKEKESKKKYLSKFSTDTKLSFLFGFLNKAYPNLYAKKIVKYLNDVDSIYHFDLIHQHDFSSNIRTTKIISKKRPVVITNHTGEFLMINHQPILRKSLKFLLSHYDHLIGPSRELCDVDFLEEAGKVSYIPNGVQTEKFSVISEEEQASLKRENGFESNEVLILCSRRWAPTKGVKYLVQAIPHVLKKMPSYNVTFLISGNDYEGYPKYREEILQFIEQHHLSNSIRLLGNIPHTKMQKIIQMSDIVILPSLMEATSLSGLEAMACKKPMIGTNVGGIPEIISHLENGILVEPENPEQIAEWICELIQDKELRNRLGTEARKTVEKKFDWKVVAQKTLNIYQKVVKK